MFIISIYLNHVCSFLYSLSIYIVLSHVSKGLCPLILSFHIIQCKMCYFQLFFMANIIFSDNLLLIFKDKNCILNCINTQVLSEYLLLKILILFIEIFNLYVGTFKFENLLGH